MYKYTLMKNWRQKIYLVLFCIYAFDTARSLDEAVVYHLTLPEFVLYRGMDHYFIMYLFFLALIYTVLREYKEKNYMMMIRFKTYAAFFVQRFLAIVTIVEVIRVISLIITVFIGIPVLNLSNRFNPFVDKNSNLFEIQSIYQGSFKNPTEALAASELYVLLGCSFIILLMMFVLETCNRTYAIVLILAIYFMTSIAISWEADEYIPYLFFNNYILLYRILSRASWQVIVIIEGILSGVIFFFIKKRWRIQEI